MDGAHVQDGQQAGLLVQLIVIVQLLLDQVE
jgi:hypothetical protein